MWRLAVVIDPRGDNIETGGSESRWRLAVRRGAPGRVYNSVNPKARGAWRQRMSRQAILLQQIGVILAMIGVTSLATPPRAPEAVGLLQPNAPQPITLLRPFILGGLLLVGIEPPT